MKEPRSADFLDNSKPERMAPNSAMATMADAYYRGYVTWKGWDYEPASERPEQHAELLRLTGKRGACDLLDIGFGRGELLDYARAQGMRTFGSELIPELRDRAAARGHTVYNEGLEGAGRGAFDIITAIDVLEHLSLEQCSAVLLKVAELLRPEGVFLARFPNGASPFCGAYQNGDLTHVRCIAPEALRQLAIASGLELVQTCNPRPIGRGVRGIKQRCAYLLRDLVETMIGLAYYQYRFPMDPNVICILRRAAHSPAGDEPAEALPGAAGGGARRFVPGDALTGT